jgi:hypothetical protein
VGSQSLASVTLLGHFVDFVAAQFARSLQKGQAAASCGGKSASEAVLPTFRSHEIQQTWANSLGYPFSNIESRLTNF